MTLVICRCRQCGEEYKHDASKESASMEDFLLSRESYPVDFGICVTCMKVMEDALIKSKRVRNPNLPLELPPADLSHPTKKEGMKIHIKLFDTEALLTIILILVALSTIFSVIGFFGSNSKLNEVQARLHKLETTSHYQGKDVDGNEVWAPAVTVVELPKKKKD